MLHRQLSWANYLLNYWVKFRNSITFSQAVLSLRVALMKNPQSTIQSVLTVLLIYIFRWTNLVFASATASVSPLQQRQLFGYSYSWPRAMGTSSNSITDNPLSAKVTCLRCIRGECQLKHYRHDGACEKIFSSFLFIWQELAPLTASLTGPGVIFTIMFRGVEIKSCNRGFDDT